MQPSNSRNAGFSLIELITVTIVLSILSVTALSGGAAWVKEWDIAGTRQDLLGESSTALNRMVREIQAIRDRQSITGVCDAITLGFTDANGNTIIFRYDAPTDILYRNFNGTGEQPLAENVTAFSFTYFRSDLQLLGTPYQPSSTYTDIRLVRIQMTISSGGQSVILRTSVSPINLQME
ncbi:MAG: prepilin-type N-terminal cleavage/methylation domain-containing protein [Pseudomonadota bacterium]